MEKKIILKNDEKYLTDYSGGIWNFNDGLPSGLINKKYTGVGATYTEIATTKRNSIIVSPTVSLAKSKSQEWREKKIHNCFYVGGGVKSKDIKEFLTQATPKKKNKFFVVADSFPRLIQILGDQVYDDYFLLIDEIDTFQIDTSYRSSLEYVIDYFHDFKEKAAVTATMIPFTDDKFSSENIDHYVIEKDEYVKTDLSLISSENELETALNVIITLLEKDENIVVAINSIKNGINRLCKSLTEHSILKPEEIGVMCSEHSKIELYKGVKFCVIETDNNNEFKLKHQLTFITSSYFVGVDFHDIFHLVIINSSTPIHATLTFEKILQITGRGRNGLFSKNIVSFETFNSPYDHFNKPKAIKIVEQLQKVYVNNKSELSGYPEQWEVSKKSFLEQTVQGEKGFLRLNFNDEIVPSYFTLDYKSHFFDTLMSYRKGLGFLESKLDQYFLVSKNSFISTNVYELEAYTSKDFLDSFHARFPDLYENLIKSIPDEYSSEGGIFNVYFFSLVEKYKASRKNYAAILQLMFFIDKHGDLNKSLTEFLKYNGKRLKIKEFKKILLLLKLRESPEYNSFSRHFMLNKEYSRDEIKSEFIEILNENINLNKYFNKNDLIDDKNLVLILNQLFTIKHRRSTKFIRGKKITVYTFLKFSSPFLDRDRIIPSYETIFDVVGVSLRYYLLNLKDEELQILD